MANPYENDASSDPFRERTSDSAPTGVPSTRAAGGREQNDGFNGYAAQSYGSDSGAEKPPNFVDGSNIEVPVKNSPAPGTGTAEQTAASAGAAAAEQPSSPAPTSKFWTVEFYQQFFDVTTQQVLIRMSNTLVPLNPPDFLMDRSWHYNNSQRSGESAAPAAAEPQQGDLIVDGITLSRAPDLYGPFWICTTLWMVLGICSNVMSKVAAARKNEKDWKYDFSVASVACVVMYLYVFVFGAAVWGVMIWKNLPVTLIDTVCLYGYSMFIFILTALLCMVPVTAAQWIFCLLGGLWSTGYLLVNFWHMWKAALEPSWFTGIVALVTVFHMGLTLSFKLYFFHYSY